MRLFEIKGALLFFENGTRRRAGVQVRTTDIEKIREVIKNKHNAQVVRLNMKKHMLHLVSFVWGGLFCTIFMSI